MSTPVAVHLLPSEKVVIIAGGGLDGGQEARATFPPRVTHSPASFIGGFNQENERIYGSDRRTPQQHLQEAA
jgi:hypothetical protein